MLYLWPQAGDVSELPTGFGIMTRPSDNTIPQGVREGRPFAVDNEAFTRGFDPARFLPFLERLQPYRDQCLFVVIPDVVYDARATIERFRTWAPVVRRMGFPVAFAAQDGQEDLLWPMLVDFTDYLYDHGNFAPGDQGAYWQAYQRWVRECVAFDVLFIAGTTEWKLGPFAEEALRRAKRLGLRVHVGRVNSQRRFRRFQLLGADFCDGTTAAYGPDQAKRRLTPVVRQPTLMTL
jgi:hypothetical protein